MSYFRELPNFEYQSPFANSTGASDFVVAKNVFRRMKLRDDLKNVFTLFNKYNIDEGERPDTVAEKEYGKSDLDWVVLLSAGIINVRNEWPLSSRDLYNYVVEKYGLAEKDFVHHYETKEIRDSQNRLIIPEGNRVDANFDITFFDNGTIVTKSEITGITNYEFEMRENIKKSTINILRRSYLQQFLRDMKKEMTYKRSSQFVNNNLIRTENTKLTN
tara:strand:+ start:1101 stop:1751 length:651 start_codon:yes stop_codon:yes gene_type:complete